MFNCTDGQGYSEIIGCHWGLKVNCTKAGTARSTVIDCVMIVISNTFLCEYIYLCISFCFYMLAVLDCVLLSHVFHQSQSQFTSNFVCPTFPKLLQFYSGSLKRWTFGYYWSRIFYWLFSVFSVKAQVQLKMVKSLLCHVDPYGSADLSFFSPQLHTRMRQVHRVMCLFISQLLLVLYAACARTQGWPGWVDLSGLLHTKMVCLPADS